MMRLNISLQANHHYQRYSTRVTSPARGKVCGLEQRERCARGLALTSARPPAMLSLTHLQSSGGQKKARASALIIGACSHANSMLAILLLLL